MDKKKGLGDAIVYLANKITTDIKPKDRAEYANRITALISDYGKLKRLERDIEENQ